MTKRVPLPIVSAMLAVALIAVLVAGLRTTFAAGPVVTMPSSPMVPGVWVIPPGHVLNLSNAHLVGNPCDTLVYGYELDGAQVALGSATACGGLNAGSSTGAVIGPFQIPAKVRLFLTDFGFSGRPCNFTYYSDGPHARIAGQNPYTVGIRDSAFCSLPPDVTAPGENLVIDVSVSARETASGPDLTVTKELKPGQPTPTAGGRIYYVLTVQNVGTKATPPPPRNVTLIDTPPSGTRVASWGILRGGGRCSSDGLGRLICDLGATIAPGAQIAVEVVLRTPVGGSLTNTAEVDPYQRIVEANEGNNRATLETVVPTGTEVCSDRFVVNDLGDTGTRGQLRSAIATACPGATIFVKPGTIALNGGIYLLTNKALTIVGLGDSLSPTVIDARRQSPVIYNDRATVNLTNLTITHALGPGIVNYGGTLNLSKLTVRDNASGSDGGGAIHNYGLYHAATVSITDSTIEGNTAPSGGGVYNYYGSVIVRRSHVAQNSASSSHGGGIFSTNGTVTVEDSSVINNTAATAGGGIYSQAGTVTCTGATVISPNSPDDFSC